MNTALTEQLLDAIELFHYSSAFRDKVVVLALRNRKSVESVLLDLKALQSSHIQAVVTCFDPQGLTDQIAPWNQCGYRIDLLDIGDEKLNQKISATLAKSRIPLVACHAGTAPLDCERETFELAVKLCAFKVLLLGDKEGLTVNGSLISCPSRQEIQALISGNDQLNIDRTRISFLHEAQVTCKFDIVVLADESGSIFTEIFTHRGSGTLFTSEYPTVLRQAKREDVASISMLMLPYVQERLILPMKDDEILTYISQFHVFTVHDQIVASAFLEGHGPCCELGKLCTLPRYRGKGRAASLVQHLVSLARQNGKKTVFTLSVDPKVGEFFRSFGFQETDRDLLPESWKAGYDFSRPSKAFVLHLA